MTALTRTIAAVREGVSVWPRWLVLGVAGIAVVLLLGLPTIITPLATDQVLYALGARTILDGGQLYKDFWEIKPPLVFLIYAIPFAVAGEHMEAIRVLDLINTLFAMAAIFLLSRRYFSERAAVLAAAFYAFTYLARTNPSDLAEAESFMAAPLALAFYLYTPNASDRRAALRALGAGLLLGGVFALKSTAILFVLGLPAAELLWRDQGGWTPRRAAERLALAVGGFLLVQAVIVAYLAIGGALSDFIDIQRHYTAPYNRYRYAPAGMSHLRFLVQATADWIKSAAFIVVPAGAALFFALFRGREARAVWLLALLSALGVVAIWWQGKMFDYHWLLLIPLLAPLAGYAVDQLGVLFSRLDRSQAWAGWALLAGGLAALALTPIANKYDDYRVLARYASGSMDRRGVEAHYYPLFRQNHEVVDYIKANSGQGDRVFVWGLWPQIYFWLDRPLVDRFAANHGLRATWAPAAWRNELIDDLVADPPRYIAVAAGDNQPWLVGNGETSDQHLRDSFPELNLLLESNYQPVLNLDLFVLYERAPVAVQGRPPSR
jgi:4-amino-4-deoxy-L-arabinose transferase-like glycosyltransferase